MTLKIQDAKKWHSRVVGVTFEGRQEVLASLYEVGAGRPSPGQPSYVEGLLEREPKNKFDPNAIKVLGKNEKGEFVQVGYLGRQDSKFIKDRKLQVHPDNIRLKIQVYQDHEDVAQTLRYSAMIEFYTIGEFVKVENAI